MANDRRGPRHAVGDPERREAGPAPDFELVRPYVGAVVDQDPEEPAADPGRPIRDGADPPTVEMGAVPPVDDVTALVPVIVTGRWRARLVPISVAAAAIVVAVLLVVAYVGFSGSPAPVSMPDQVVPAGLPSVPMPSPSPSPSASPSASTAPVHAAPTPRATKHHSAPSPSTSPSAPASPSPQQAPSATVPQFPPAAPFTGAIVGLAGKCLDDNGAVNGDGNRIQLYSCNGSAAQVWTWQTDGTLQVVGKCLQVTGVGAGGLAELWDCDGSPSEVWHATRHGGIVNAAADLCLEVPGSNTNDGTQLDLASCSRQANQRWTEQH
jgi:hypothetical protein